MKRSWTEAEVLRLEHVWQTGKPLAPAAQELGRTVNALRLRAYWLGFGLRARDAETVAGLAKRTGYNRSTLTKALKRCRLQSYRRGSRRGWFMLSPRQVVTLLAEVQR